MKILLRFVMTLCMAMEPLMKPINTLSESCGDDDDDECDDIDVVVIDVVDCDE